MAKEKKGKEKAKPEIKAITVSGKRKRALAKATIKAGTGIVKINKKPLETFNFIHRAILQEPLRLAEDLLKEQTKTFDLEVSMAGGGSEAQIEAARLAIARAIVAYTGSEELKKAYTNYDWSLLVADVRRKEQRKPGDSKARAKRQKSYR